MSLSKLYKTNTDKEKNGFRYVVDSTDGKDVAFTISRMSKSNQRYTAMLESKTKPYRRQLQNGTLSDEIAEQIELEIFCSAVLLGWEGVTNLDVYGQDVTAISAAPAGFPSSNPATVLVPFSSDAAMSLFKNLPELYQELKAQANSAAAFRDESLEAEAKN